MIVQASRRTQPSQRVCARWGGLVGLTMALVLVASVSFAQPAASSTRYAPPAPVFGPGGAALGETWVGESAHILLIAFSGRCALRVCRPPDENEDALARRLVPAVVAAWLEHGYTVEVWTYRSHVDDDPVRGRGYASAADDLMRAVQDGSIGPVGETRVVLLGYSHGTQFAHLLAFEHPEVPIAATVLLDSICWGWDDDHAERLVAELAPGRGPWALTGPFEVGCDVLSVPGLLGHLDLGDVVPWNVARSLEVRSDGQVLGAVRDVRDNVRPDGSRAGIEVLRVPGLRHQDTDEPDGAAFEGWTSWVVGVLGR